MDDLTETIKNITQRQNLLSERLDNLLDNQKTTSDILLLQTTRIMELEAALKVLLQSIVTISRLIDLVEENNKEVH